MFIFVHFINLIVNLDQSLNFLAKENIMADIAKDSKNLSFLGNV
jgi:hypothetical protein